MVHADKDTPLAQHDDRLLRQLVRQMKIMNFWITLFGGLFLVGFIIAGFLLWQMVSFINETNRKLDAARSSVGDSLDVQKQTCQSDTAFGRWLKDNTEVCR